MKIWINRWFVLRPGKLIYFKEEKYMVRDRCVGILRLGDCKVLERPTHKDGFSFKIYHLLHYPIYHKYGLRGETLKFAMLPVSWNYCILRVSSETERKNWMDNINAQIEYANMNGYRDPAFKSVTRPDIFQDELFSDSEDEQREIEDSETGSEKHPLKSPVARELAEDLFQKNEEMRKNLMDGLSVQQKNTVKSLQRRTIKTMEEWKKELDSRISNSEKNLTSSITEQMAQSQQRIFLTYVQFFTLLVITFLLARHT